MEIVSANVCFLLGEILCPFAGFNQLIHHELHSLVASTNLLVMRLMPHAAISSTLRAQHYI